MQLKNESTLNLKIPAEIHEKITTHIEHIADICRYKEVSVSASQAVITFFSRPENKHKLDLLKQLKNVTNPNWWITGKIEDKKSEFIETLVAFWDLKNPPFKDASSKDYFLKAPLLELVLLKFASNLEKQLLSDHLIVMNPMRPKSNFGTWPGRIMKWELKKFPSLLKYLPHNSNTLYFAITFDELSLESCTKERERIAVLYNEHATKDLHFAKYDQDYSPKKGDLKVYFQADLLCNFLVTKIKDIAPMDLMSVCHKEIENKIEKEQFTLLNPNGWEDGSAYIPK